MISNDLLILVLAALYLINCVLYLCNINYILIYRCEMAAGNPIDILDGIDTSGFYFQLGVAQVQFVVNLL